MKLWLWKFVRFWGNITITTKFDLQDVHNLWNCEIDAEILFWISNLPRFEKFKFLIFEWFSKFKMKNHKSHKLWWPQFHNITQCFSRLFYDSAFNGCVMCSTICSFNFLKSKENLKLTKCAGKYWAHSIWWNAMMSLFDI